ncbi:MAG: RagB/SusD family nutrient uptake outer membrane protein [Bacteroidales bacterium]|nr:RagB/SusD family nutrient uptake outer membrane protein [Bacteroidales bacterium]
MKRNISILISLFFVTSIIAQSNIICLNTDDGDSVILRISSTYEVLQWQNSADGLAWADIPGETGNTYSFVPKTYAFYRAELGATTCDSLFSGYSDIACITRFNETADSLSEPELNALLEICPLTMRAFYSKEVGCDFTEVGTDLYMMGADNRNYHYAVYDSNFFWGGESIYRTGAMWNQLYRGLLDCNAAIHYNSIASYLSVNNKLENEVQLRFLRAYYLWLITETWGGAMYTDGFYPNKPSTFYSVSVDFMYDKIFTDLTFVESNITAQSDSNTVITKPVVEAFMARMHLTRGNYAEALDYANTLINYANYYLYSNYDTLWYIHKRNNKEIIYAIDNTINPDPLLSFVSKVYTYYNNIENLCVRQGGNQNHLIWAIRYENTNWGLTRALPYERGFIRYQPTRFLIDLFDANLDQRFNGSFRTVWYCNTTNAPNWPSTIYIEGNPVTVDPALIGTRMVEIGDTALLLYKGSFPDSLRAKLNLSDKWSFHKYKGYLIFDLDDMYLPDETPNYIVNENKYYFPIIGKFADSTRATVSQEYSSRNAPIIRLAEMYLIAAEAAMEIGLTDSSYNYLLALANVRSYTGDGAGLLSAYGVNSGVDIDIDFILDERARELAGEQLRWFDLKRTGKLVERVTLHNPDAAPNIKEFHNLRPVPLDFEYLLYKSNDLQQSPGYFE